MSQTNLPASNPDFHTAEEPAASGTSTCPPAPSQAELPRAIPSSKGQGLSDGAKIHGFFSRLRIRQHVRKAMRSVKVRVDDGDVSHVAVHRAIQASLPPDLDV